MPVYEVLREMEGDRFYKAGEFRDLDKTDAAHLVGLNVIRETAFETVEAATELSAAAKAEAAVLNKAEAGAPLNKAAPALVTGNVAGEPPAAPAFKPAKIKG